MTKLLSPAQRRNQKTSGALSHMHKPDPKLPPDQQDKRSIIALAESDVDVRLAGTQQQAQAPLKLPAVEWFETSPT